MAVDDSDSDDELLMKDADASWTKVRGTITNARDAIAKIQKEFGTHVKPRADGAGPSSAPPKSRSARDPAAAALSDAAVALSDAALVFATVPDSSDKENAPAASEAAKSSPADDDELVVTGHSGIRGALNDFPHARSLCATFPLATHPPRTSCPNCFCFVCETPAPCASWGAGDAPDADHCLASERDQTWRARRDAERAKRADAAPNAAAAGGDAEDPPPVLGAHAPPVGDAGDDGAAAAEVNAEDVANILDGLRDAEATEERDVPEGSLKVTLMKHQRRALAWAMKKEANARCRGGILADDQGLGKTVSMMAVIVSAPPPEREAKPGAHVLRRRRAIGDLGRDRGGTIERRRSDPAGAGAGARGSLDPPPAAAAAPPHLPGCVCAACKLAKRAKRSAAKERERKRGVALAFGDSDDEDAMAAKERHERREAQRAAARLSGGDARRGVGGVGPGKVPARTLVVCPAIVMQQWKDELDEKSNLRSVVYHGAARSRLDEATLLAHDVVVTTYGVVCGEFRVGERDGTVGALFNVSWHRVILDEAHIIRNRRTYGSVSVSALQARCRWCLSGTPLMNSADDVYPLFRFLRYQPFASWPHFNGVISRDANRVGGGGHRAIGAMTRLRVAMRAVTLRRTKATLIDGRPIVDLPPRVVEDRVVAFDAAERDFYDALENNVGVAFDTFVRRGWKANYMHILVLLLQLRQACDHPLLIKGARGGGVENGQDGDENGNGFASKADLIAALGADRVVALEKAMREYRQCDICYGPCENPSATAPCGHGPTCAECMRAALQANMQATGRDFGACPQCRGAVDERNGILSLEALAPGRGGNRAAGGDDSDDEADFRNVDAADVVARVLAKARRRAEVLGRKLEAEAAEAARKGKAPEEKPREEAPAEAAPIANSAKIRAILEELGKTRDEAPEGTLPEQTIVFSQFVAFLDMLEPEVAREHAVLRLDGRQMLGTRANVVQAFRRGEASVLLVSLKAASLGLNLNCASRVIIADPWWNAAVEDQAIDRCHRIGQTRPVRVLKMIVHASVERRVQHLQERKRAIADAALGDGEQVVAALRQRLNLRDLHDLFGRERPVRDGGHAGGADGVRCKCRLARCKTCICATVGHACTALCGCGGRCANAERR